MVSQQALCLYSIIHAGRLGVDRNKGHEIVMKQCDGADGGDYDDRVAAGKCFVFPRFSKTQKVHKRPDPSFPSVHYCCPCFSLLPVFSCMI